MIMENMIFNLWAMLPQILFNATPTMHNNYLQWRFSIQLWVLDS